MSSVAEILRYANLAVLASLALVAAYRLRRGGTGAGWVAAAFAALLAIFAFRLVTTAVGGEESGDSQLKVLVGIAVLFPYLLFRFSASLQSARRTTEIVVAGLVLLTLAATAALPEVPLDDDIRPAWFRAYLVVVLAEWTVVLGVAAGRLWAGGRGEPRLARYRMRSLGVGAAVLVLAVVLAAFGPAERGTGLDVAFRLLVLMSAVTFFLAFAPPPFVRQLWRRPEQGHAQRATQALVAATAPDDVLASVLPTMARLVGANAIALLDAEDEVVGSHGLPPAVVATLEKNTRTDEMATEELGGRRPLRVPLATGSALVWASPYAPVFGDDELELLRALGALAELALERAQLFEQERQAREILEQADELKSGFIALAAHELRGPAATVYGIAELLYRKAETLPAESQGEFRRMLHEEAGRLVRLLDELLDLSRLEAGAIEIRPEPIRVREQLEQLVPAIAGERKADVSVEADPALVTWIDPNAFERIVGNLVANALRYGERPVVVTARQSDRHFRLCVEDRGPGVPAEFVPQLFERFTRSKEARAKPGGTGLGLSIAQAYAHAHGGILVYQDAEPRGARFELVLPHAPRTAGDDDA